MPKSKEYVSSSDESNSSLDEKTAKRKRKHEKEKQEKFESKKAKKPKEEETEPSWEISKNRFVKIRTFKGKLYVDIREMYNDNGELKPGKKGICMDMIQWRKFMECVEEIDKVAKSKC